MLFFFNLILINSPAICNDLALDSFISVRYFKNVNTLFKKRLFVQNHSFKKNPMRLESMVNDNDQNISLTSVFGKFRKYHHVLLKGR